jgi:hypothetical protein
VVSCSEGWVEAYAVFEEPKRSSAVFWETEREIVPTDCWIEFVEYMERVDCSERVEEVRSDLSGEFERRFGGP